MFHVLGAIAEFERALIQERTRAGLSEARRRSRAGGRPKLMSPKDVSAARALMKLEDVTARRGRQAVWRLARDALPSPGSHARGGGILMAAPVQLYLFADLAPPQADVWLRRWTPGEEHEPVLCRVRRPGPVRQSAAGQALGSYRAGWAI